MPRFIKGIETNFLGRMTAAQAGALTNAVPGDEVYVTDAGTGMQAFRNAAGAWIAFDTGIAIVGGAVATVPAAMAAPTLTPGDTQITVARAAAPSNGGSAITSYDARRSTDGTNWTTITGIGTSQALTGLVNGTAYQVQTRAVNAVGPGAWSPSATATPVAASGVTKLPANPRFGVGGDSIFAGTDTRNLTEVIATASRSRMQAGIGSRIAQGGRTMQDMLNEVLLGGDTQIGGLTKQKFDVVIFDGGTNDLAPGGGATPRTLAEMQADHQSIVDQLKASGVKLVVRITIPRTKTVDDSTSKRQMFNAWLKTKTDILLVDVENTFDPNDLTYAYTDGIHPNINGVFYSYAIPIVQAMEPYFDTSFDATAADAANLDPDTQITATGGTIGAGIAADSTVAAGWTVANTSSATVRVDTIAGRMRVTASGSASAVGLVTLTNSVPVSGNFTPGKNIRATQKVRLSNSAGTAGAANVRLLAGAAGTFGGFLSTTYDVVSGPVTQIIDGVMQMVPKRWSGGGSPSISSVITLSLAAGAQDFVFDLGSGNALLSETVAYAIPALVPGRIEPLVSQAAASGNTTITADFGAWYGGGYAFTFQHFKNGVAISGATARTYVQPTSGAAGDYFCDITCTNAMGAKTFRTPAITVVP